MIGSLNEFGDKDGVVSLVMLYLFYGLEIFGKILFVCDSGNKVIWMIMNGKFFKRLLEIFY